jgi:hypothetical protein
LVAPVRVARLPGLPHWLQPALAQRGLGRVRLTLLVQEFPGASGICASLAPSVVQRRTRVAHGFIDAFEV